MHDAQISRYIERVRQLPVLDRETEHQLAIRALEGDRASIDALVEANLRYVVAVALQYRRYGIPIAELVAEGNMGLMMAVRKFDPHRGTRFVTYAGYWIRAYVLDCVVRSTTMVGAGSGPLRSKLFFRLRRERARVANLVGDTTERNEMLAERFGVSPEKMREMTRRLDARDISLDQPLFDDSGATLGDSLPGSLSQEDEFFDGERQSAVEARLIDALAALDRRERFIVEQRLMAEDEMSLAAIGRKLGVSRERARQLEARAKKKLKKSLGELEVA